MRSRKTLFLLTTVKFKVANAMLVVSRASVSKAADLDLKPFPGYTEIFKNWCYSFSA